MERYRRRGSVNMQKEDKGDFKKKLKKQTIACAVIFVIIFLTGFLKTETAIKFNERIGSSLSYTVDYKGTVTDIVEKIGGFAKEVQDVIGNTESSN